jgi:hypothetical protein
MSSADIRVEKDSMGDVPVPADKLFFSMPLPMLAWPVGVGMLAHALRWWLRNRDCHNPVD